MNKKVTFLFIGDSKGQKYFTMNIFHTKNPTANFSQTTVVRFLIKIIATDWPDQNNFDYLSTSESSNNS